MMRGIAVVLLAVVALVGCGDDEDSTSDETAAEAEELATMGDPVGDITELVEGVGLPVCPEEDTPGDTEGASESTVLVIGACDGHDDDLTIATYADADAATAAFDDADPKSEYVIWLMDPTTTASVKDTADPGTIDDLQQAFESYPMSGTGADL